MVPRITISSIHQSCSKKEHVLKNAATFTGNTCARVYFLVEAYNFIKKDTLAQVFSFEFLEIIKNTFFTEHLWTTASVSISSDMLVESLCD